MNRHSTAPRARLHRPVAMQVIQALQQIFGEGYHADKVIERLFKLNRQLGSRDRKFVAETTYEIVRWWRFLWATLKLQPSLENADLWQLLGAWLVLNDQEIPPWSEWENLCSAKEGLLRQAAEARLAPAVRESVPDWLYELGETELGADWPEILAQLNRPAPVVLRANRLKITRDDLQKLLHATGVETDFAPDAPDGLILKERRNVFTTDEFKQGLFEIQDGASQQIAMMMDAQPGQRVIDACAGAGGKTLHLAAFLRNKGKIIAMDVHERKLEELRRRCTRAGVDIVEVKTIESAKTIKRLEKSADRLLLDVPCSGLGVIRRNPDAKWKLKPEEIVRLQDLQKQILFSYSEMLKPGGRMVYATCSILPSENERQVAAFLQERGSAWKLLDERRFRPGVNGYDGFYAAALERQ